MLASKTLMHESFGHNKILFNKKNRLVSLLRFYNKQKKFVQMVLISSTTKHEKNLKIEYFRVLNKKLTGESGKFFEYFLGNMKIC